jgi:hypothetical protein
MKTAGRENPNHYRAIVPRNRAHGAVGQNRSRSIKWAAKQEKFQPEEMCFFLTSPFIELHGSYDALTTKSLWSAAAVYEETQPEDLILAASPNYQNGPSNQSDCSQASRGIDFGNDSRLSCS